MQPKVYMFPITARDGRQGLSLGTGDEDHERLERLEGLIRRLDAMVPRLEKLAEQLQWEISGLIWSRGE